MPIHNSDISDVFFTTADLLEIKGENQFRVRAYRDAARTIKGLSRDVTDLINHNEPLDSLPGIGKDLAGKILTIVREGKLPLLEELKKEMPGDLSAIMHVSGLGPKRVKRIVDELNITTIDELRIAAEQNLISKLDGFSEKTQKTILEELERIKDTQSRFKLSDAEEIITPFYNYLKRIDGVGECVIAGSFRRRLETVGDIDILVTCENCAKIMDAFTSYDDVIKVLSHGITRSIVRLRNGLQVDLRVVKKESYGAALHYFTGSKEHSIAVRFRAVGMDLKINEYGVFRGDERIAGETEKSVYETVGLPYYEPELRENRGELDITDEKDLPKLVEPSDIRGDLHTHTKLTDGHYTLEEMADAARALGYEYIANTEHSHHVAVARGLTAEQAIEQMESVRKYSDKLKDFTVLTGIEVDILEDGSLDLPDDVLKEMEVVVCSVHSRFGMPKEKQTKRILKAMDNPHFMIMGHPTGRLINVRKPYDIDMEKIMNAAAARGIVLEINAHPNRLDLNDIYIKMAVELGVKIVISTDAHTVNEYNNIKYGIGQARRGWLEGKDVINTRPLNELRKLLVHRI